MATEQSVLTAQTVKPALLFNIPSQQQVSVSTGWILANNNAKTAESDVDDPVQYALTSPQTKVFTLDSTGKSYIAAALLYLGTDPATSVKVRAFGFFRLGLVRGDVNGQDPHSVSASYPAQSAADVGGGFWTPLYRPEPSGEHEQSFNTTPDVVSDGTSNHKLTGGVVWATEGAERVIILVTATASDPTVSCVLARLGN